MASYDYDLIVIGGGAAGLTSSGIGATFGAKTLMVERARLGGDCTWYGCIPSKTLLKSAKVAHHIRHASRFGLTDQPVQFDFKRLMEHVRSIRQDVYEEADDPKIYEDMGIDVKFGEARFVDAHTISLTTDAGTQAFTGRLFIIAAGARAFVPPIEGIQDVPYLTNESLFELDEQPQHLAIVGGGPIGTEMAQAFVRLGTNVTVIDRSDQILGKDDPELAKLLQAELESEGVQYVFGATVERASSDEDGTIQLHVTQKSGPTQTIEADQVLLATGRRANVDALDLPRAGIFYDQRGITVNDRCQTNVGHIYAVGDITGRYQFTHMSEHMAKVAATNALLKVPMSIDTKHVPWVTFTDPEMAHVGATQAELDKAGTAYETYRFPYTKVDRAIAEKETVGMIKVYAKSFNGKILGADVLGTSAGELISEYALAMRNGITLRQMADTIHPYPSYGLGARRAADQWYIKKQSTFLPKVLQTVFGYNGPIIEPDPDRII
ncbi:MAG: FAD-dependent oxidoreductase [Rhodothermales bacterium]